MVGEKLVNKNSWCLVVCIAALTLTSQAGAALVDINLTRVGATNDWQLRMNVNGPLPIGAVAVEVSSSLSLAHYDAPTIDLTVSFVGDEGLGYTDVILIDASPSSPIVTGPVQNLALVTLHSSNGQRPVLLDGEFNFGGTVFLEPTFETVPISQISLTVTPEPSAAALLGLLFAAALAPRALGRLTRP
jgi:hypothetical protein